MYKNIWSTYQFIDYLDVKNTTIKKMPLGVSISTMCAKSSLGTKLNLTNIQKYMPLNINDILTVKINSSYVRTLIKEKKKKRKTTKKQSNNPFYNQVTIVVSVFEDNDIENLDKIPKLNLKLFKNGTIQISGLRNIEYANRAINKLIYRLSQIKGIMVDNKIEEINFIENKKEISIYDFSIYMINANYRVNMKIDRSKLYHLLLKKKIKVSYEKCIRACVIVKFTPPRHNEEEKEVSIFIFEKGNIIITGARNIYHIIDAYNYMNDIILVHCDEINKVDEEMENIFILELYDEVIKESEHKNNSKKIISK